MQRKQLGAVAVFAAVYILYVIGGTLAWWTINASGLGAVFFPPAGLTLVAFLALPRHRWPLVVVAVIAGEFTTGMTVGWAGDSTALFGFGVANAVGPLIGAILLGLLLGRAPGLSTLPDLGRRRELIMFGVAGVAIGPCVSGFIGAFTAWSRFGSSPMSLQPQWWLGDALGVIVVAPALLAWNATRGTRPWRGAPALMVVAAAWIGASATLLTTDLPLMFLVFSLLIVAGALFDVRTLALTGVVIAIVVGISLALDPTGLISGLTASEALTNAKLEFFVFAIAAYIVTAETNERVLAANSAVERLATVGQLQRLLLPPITVTGSGYRVRGVYDAAVHDIGVGGDWYFARETLDGRLVFAVGDIVGHDIDAALSMASVRSGLSIEAAIDPHPGRLLARLDDFSDAEPSIRYGTAWVGVFDPETRRLDYACAGHPPPLLATPDSTVRLDGANTALVGLPQGERRLESVAVPSGAALLMYSDGLIETRDATIDDGIDRLVDAIAAHGLDPNRLAEQMLRDSPRDDDTILAVVDFDATDDAGQLEHDELARESLHVG